VEGQNIRRVAEDVTAGQLLLRAGARLSPRHLALLAATGLAAAVYPVWVATRLPIAATLRFETVS
jgi:molybdopterin molybdotransferase